MAPLVLAINLPISSWLTSRLGIVSDWRAHLNSHLQIIFISVLRWQYIQDAEQIIRRFTQYIIYLVFHRSNKLTSADLEKLIGKAFINKTFRREWHANFEKISDDLNIDQAQRVSAKALLNQMADLFGSQGLGSSMEYSHSVIAELQKSTPNVAGYTFNVLKDSMKSAQNAFKNITRMSHIIFGVGISLFAITVISGFIRNEPANTAIFGSLGIASFVTFFILGPTSYVQKALSNLLQAEIVFMNFWDQMHFWAPYGVSTKMEETREGSSKLQQVTKEILEMLEKYIEKGDQRGISSLLKRSTQDQSQSSADQ